MTDLENPQPAPRTYVVTMTVIVEADDAGDAIHRASRSDCGSWSARRPDLGPGPLRVDGRLVTPPVKAH